MPRTETAGPLGSFGAPAAPSCLTGIWKLTWCWGVVGGGVGRRFQDTKQVSQEFGSTPGVS